MHHPCTRVHNLNDVRGELPIRLLDVIVSASHCDDIAQLFRERPRRTSQCRRASPHAH